MSSLGYIKLHRALIDKPIWECSTPEHKAILITILLLANYEEKHWLWKGEKYKCLPGQFVTSLPKLALKSGTSIQSVRTALKNFEKMYDFLTDQSTESGRLITVVNWALYQSNEIELTDQLTGYQQTANRPLTATKKDKNIRIKEKELKVRYAEFVSMTEIEYQKLITEHGEMAVTKFIEILNLYKGSSGKKYLSDYMAILKWVIDRYKEEQAKGTKPAAVPQKTNYKQREYDDGFFDDLYFEGKGEGK